MKDKIILFFRRIRKNVILYIATNRLFLTYVILAMLGLMLVRGLTIEDMWSFKPFITDLAMVLIIGSLGYLVKPKNQYRYFMIVLIVFTVMEFINSIYFTFYVNFASFGELGTVGQTETVMGSVYERLKFTHIMYVIFPILFYFIHKKLLKTTYYNFMSVVEKGKKMCVVTILIGCLCLAYTFVTATKTDYSRLAKQWNRVLVVKRFGLALYQVNDLIQTLTPKFSSLFGYDEAAQSFIQYFTSDDILDYKEDNRYTNILEGYNIVFIHMEGIQTFLMDVSFNGVEATPNLNKIASEGMFFTNFYPQISIGTSSDTEFTLNTSIIPATSGAVFTQYYDRDYITIPKLLKNKGYYTFSMHGNSATMWNRDDMHPAMGYDDMYFEESYTYNKDSEDPNNLEYINLGISDKKFFEQVVPIMENIEKNHTNYMGTIITLSNHSPFKYLEKYGEYDMSTTYQDCDELTGECSDVTTNYLYGTAVGNYIMSSHYADEALGEFFNYVNESDAFDKTIFVLYGDHDAKLTRNEINYLYNYDATTGELKSEDDPTYVSYDEYDHELNKNTPLIIWTKDRNIRNKLHGEVDYVMGMYDVAPTIGNMLGIDNPFQMGHDIFNIKDNNYVIFPNGNFLTNLIYYNNSEGQYKVLQEGAELTTDYITNLQNKTEKMLEVSNALIVHDLIKNEGETVLSMKENEGEE